MNFITQLLDFVGRMLRWWVVISPWEQAVRVRLGNRVKLLPSGVHLCVPFMDAVYPQNVRRRAQGCLTQTVSTLDGVLVTFAGTLRYSIVDVMKLQTTLHDASDTVRFEAQAIAAEYIATHEMADVTPSKLARHVTGELDYGRYGLSDAEFAIQDFAAPRRVIRVIQDSLGNGLYGNNGLSTCQSPLTSQPSPR